MTIESQIADLDRGVEEFARCVSSLNEGLFLEKLDGWSPRDITAHLIGWNRYVIEGSKQIRRGELPFYDNDPGENYSKVNAVLVRKYASTEKHELLQELEVSCQELRRFMETLDPEEWVRDCGVVHAGSPITIKTTVDELIADYAHHQEQIEDWARRLAAS